MLFVLFATIAWLVFGDEAPPDVSDLMPEPQPPGSDADSVSLGLLEISRALPVFPLADGTVMNWTDQYFELSIEATDRYHNAWSQQSLVRFDGIAELQSQMEAYFASSVVTTEQIEAVLDRPGRDCYPAPEERPIEISASLKLRMYLSDKAFLARLRGDAPSSSQTLLLALHVAEVWKHEANVSVSFLVQCGASGGVWSAVESLLYDSTLAGGWESEWLFRPTLPDVPPEVFRELIRNEFLDVQKYIELIQAGAPGPLASWSPDFDHWKHRWFLKRNRTVRLVAEEFRRQIATAQLPTWEWPAPRPAGPATPDFWKAVLARNSVEPSIDSLAWCDSLLEKYAQLVLRERIGRTQLALRIFERSHGNLPLTLEALVPEVDGFDSVPLDPYSGQPLQYDPARRIVWSVGHDGSGNSNAAAFQWEDSDEFEFPEWISPVPPLSR